MNLTLTLDPATVMVVVGIIVIIPALVNIIRK